MFEKNLDLGGHTRTKFVKEANNYYPIDTGFIVFNEINYPDLVKFFEYLNIRFDDSDMSFGVSNFKPHLEYSGKNIFSLFALPKNFFSIKYLKMLKEIHRFFKLCNSINLEKDLLNTTLSTFLDQNNFSNYVRRFYINPMISSIWSSNLSDIENFPLVSFINFFKNHGLFNLKQRPKWKYVVGGSKKYIDALISLKLFKYSTNFAIQSIDRKEKNIEIVDYSNKKYLFDKLVFATHADQVLSLLKEPSKREIEILSKFKYTKNIAYLHTDNRLMPKKKIAWSSWNYIQNLNNKDVFTLTYWMNNLQKLQTKNNYFVTINPPFEPHNVLDKTVFEHPIFSIQTLVAQKRFLEIQGYKNSFFCGSYLGYGFHEDGIQSAAYIAKLMGIELPWKRKDIFSNRLQLIN